MSKGFFRKMDQFGRIVLPKELRTLLDIDVGTPVGIFIDDEKIILKKHTSNCIFCRSNEDLEMVLDKSVCAKCMEKLKK
jgi:AbrB family transcriptional regulator, transcriptional pleiotropic regulator of transition state genes